MPIAMAASTVFSFLCRRFLTAIMHGFERRFLFPAHGCFCGGCCPPLPPRLQRAWSRYAVLQSVVSRLVCPLLWLWGEVFPRGVLLVSRGRSVATGATTQAPWWLALSRRAGCGCGWCVAPGRGVWCVWHAIHCRIGGGITSPLRHSTPHCQARACLVLPTPITKNGARLSTIRSLAS